MKLAVKRCRFSIANIGLNSGIYILCRNNIASFDKDYKKKKWLYTNFKCKFNYHN